MTVERKIFSNWMLAGHVIWVPVTTARRHFGERLELHILKRLWIT